MSDIVAFLLARVSESEAAAREEDEIFANTSLLPTYDSDHQARWNTEAVLSLCAATRRIVARWQAEQERLPEAMGVGMAALSGVLNHIEALDWAIRDLAAVDDDHPDYRQEWRPVT